MTPDLTRLLAARGWATCAVGQDASDWIAAARAAGLRALADPEMRARWLQCEGTWFVGVDALPNGADGSLDGVPLPLAVAAILAPFGALHRAQLSVVFPGYPRPRAGESAAAFSYRLRRDAAHVDGITAEGPDRRRNVTEPHGIILGLPLSGAAPGSSPLVVWEGSPAVMGAALRQAHEGTPERAVDVTEVYVAARRRVFETCRRVAIVAAPGEMVLLHRHALHGIAPWTSGQEAEPRMIAYFRPLMPGGLENWLVSEA